MQGTELSSPIRLAKDSGNSIAINVKTSNGWKLTCLAQPVECTYLRCLECIKTLSVDNEAGKWDATVLLSGTYRDYYLGNLIGRSRSILQGNRGTWLHMSSRAHEPSNSGSAKSFRETVSGHNGLNLGHHTRADKL